MYITSINKKECFKLVLCSKRNFFTPRLASAREIYESLKPLWKNEPVWISDMFPHDYVYKPLSCDLLEVSNDDDYKILKTIKAAKYIHNSLFENKGGRLLKNIMEGEIVIEDGYIDPAFFQKLLQIKKEIHPEFLNPIVYNIREKTMFDIYLGTNLQIKDMICKNQTLKLAGNEYELSSVESIIQPSGKVFVLQAAAEIENSYRISAGSKSMFRVYCDSENNIQYFKAGSVIDKDDCINDEAHVGLYPYIMFREE